MKTPELKGSIGSLGSTKRAPVKLLQEELVGTEPLNGDRALPLLVLAAVQPFDPLTFAEANREFVRTRLLKHGGILFRDFNIHDTATFDQFIARICGASLEYTERSSPRSQVSGNIYTSTDYPPDQAIFLHNEHSYRHNFPMKIFFHCVVPAMKGGDTPIADVRRIFQKISPSVREKFIQKQIMYVRNFGNGMGLSWQMAFQTSDKEAVERYCHNIGIQVEWRENDRLRTRQVRPAVARHPETGESVWFNHGTFFHVSTLPPGIRDGLLRGCQEEDLPNNTYYGDGSPIEPAVLDELRRCYEAEKVSFPWKAGDVLMLDNMLVAHGRGSYQGPRQVLVGMADLFSPPAS